jgi:hypothetical protein
MPLLDGADKSIRKLIISTPRGHRVALGTAVAGRLGKILYPDVFLGPLSSL